MISIIVPVYGCTTTITELFLRAKKAINSIGQDFELIFVNDKGPFDAWEAIVELSAKDYRIKGINLSRNFGQHSAIASGLSIAAGDWIVVMDCDLQDKPEEIPNLYKKATEGFDVVQAKRTNRQDSFFKKIGSRMFYATLGYLTDTEQNAEIANFGIYHKKVVSAILSMNDHIKYFPAMVKWVGFNQTAIEVEHSKRDEGKSSYTLKSLLHLALNTILSFSDKPLRLTIKFGAIISLLSLVYGSIVLVKYFLDEIAIQGYASIIISIWFLSGIIIMIMGMVGLYIGKTFEQVKGRPVFIIDETINFGND